MKKCRNQTALTLVEVLVSIMIVAVLAAALGAGLGRTRKAAGGAKCVANLRQLGVAVHLYVTDNDGTLPGLGPTNSLLYMKEGWRPTIASYMGEPKGTYLDVFRCPTASEDPDVKPAWKEAITLRNSYGINKKFLFKKMAAISRPAEKALIVDVYDGYLSSAESFFDNAVPWRVSRRHLHQSTNVLWIDGHVSSMQTDLLKDSQYILPD